MLSLGGGPQATTIELAIYRALSYDDLGRAAMLALIQLSCCLGLVLISQRLSRALPVGHTHAQRWRNPEDSLWRRVGFSADRRRAAAAAASAGGDRQRRQSGRRQRAAPAGAWQALFTSLRIALGAGLLCVALTMMLQWSSRELRQHLRGRWS